MEDPNYSNLSKFHLGQHVVRKLDSEMPKDIANVVRITFLAGGTIEYGLVWEDGGGGTAYEMELAAIGEQEILTS